MFTIKSDSCAFSALLILALLLAPAEPVNAAPNPLAESLQPAQTSKTFSSLQYTSGGHVLGFDVGKVYMAGLDHALTVEFIGGQENAPVGVPAAIKFKSGSTPALGQVIYKNAWRGVDIIYTSTNVGIVESTYVVQPGASPADIRLKYNTPVELSANRTLRFDFETGSMTESAPIAFQEIEDRHIPVEAHYMLKAGQVGFAVGAYDPNYPLTIDPIYAWHTFYGSSTYDSGYAIARDGDGNIYVTGESSGAWNGPNSTPPLNPYAGGSDIVVVKLNSAGAYQWHTFYGTWRYGDEGAGLTSDGNGNIYVAGFSGGGWTGPNSTPPLNPHSDILPVRGYDDIVVVKLNSVGAYQWHTFYGGSSIMDAGHAIISDGNGNIYVAGYSGATWNGSNSAAPLNAHSGSNDIVVLKLDSAGAYQWHTFYGSSTYDECSAMTNDGAGNLYLTGYSGATWNGPNSTPPLNTHTGGGSGTTNDYDIVVVKLNSAGAYQWHTFYGSSIYDLGQAITNDGAGNLYVAGYSEATWNGPNSTAPLNAHAGSNDIAVIKLNSVGAYQWHTFYGSSNSDSGHAITSDGTGNLYLAGGSNATWNGPNSAAPLNAHSSGGDSDIVVVKLTANPSAAVLISPNGDIGTNFTPTYTWTKVADATWYYLWVNGPSGNVFKKWYEASAACSGGTCSVTPADLTLNTGIYTWWVQTWNTVGYGPWSAGMTFSVPLPPLPDKATLISPAVSAWTKTPTYVWNEVSGASWYYLWVDGPSGNVIKKWYSHTQANCDGSTCSVTPDTALSAAAYTWWVRTWNETGYGPWSDAMTFSPTPPGKAILFGPSGPIPPPPPHLSYTTASWSAVPGATWYYVWVNGPSGNVLAKWFSAAERCNATHCTVMGLMAFSDYGDYIWWVQTWNEVGFGPWSDGMTFTNPDYYGPQQPSLISPSGSITSLTPTFTWTAVGSLIEVHPAMWYDLWIDGPSGNIFNHRYTYGEVGCIVGHVTCSITPALTLQPGVTYRWWVRGENDHGLGPWSEGMTFTPTLPEKATLISPTGSSGTTTPTYIWNEVSNSTWYYLWINGPSGNAFKKWYEASAVCSGGTCSVKPAGATLTDGNYSWWIQTWNDVGYGSWSDRMNFTVP